MIDHSFETALNRLKDFYEENVTRGPDEVGDLIGRDDMLQDAALVFLRNRFTQLHVSTIDPDADYSRPQVVALRAIPYSSGERKLEFLRQVVFKAAKPGVLIAFGKPISRSFSPETFEQELLTALRSGNALHMRNALSLPYPIYSVSSSFALSEAGRAEIEAEVAALRKQPELSPGVAEALACFELPPP
jgi:hypothetical protein